MPGETDNSENNETALRASPSSHLNASNYAFAGNIFSVTSSKWQSYIRRSGLACSIFNHLNTESEESPNFYLGKRSLILSLAHVGYDKFLL